MERAVIRLSSFTFLVGWHAKLGRGIGGPDDTTRDIVKTKGGNVVNVLKKFAVENGNVVLDASFAVIPPIGGQNVATDNAMTFS